MRITITLAASEAEARANLAEIIADRREDFAGLSRMIGRPAGYLRRHVREGKPRRIAEGEARDLAGYFRVAPQLFGTPLDAEEA
jgi:hypothetical protein